MAELPGRVVTVPSDAVGYVFNSHGLVDATIKPDV